MLSLPPSGGTGNKIVPAKLFGEDRYDKIYQELISEGRIEGENLTPNERKEGVKAYRRSKIDFEKFVNRVNTIKAEVSASKPSTPLTPKLALAPAAPPAPPEAPPSPDVVEDEDIDGIDQKLDDLLDEIRTQTEIEEKQGERERKDKEKEKRSKKENKLESAKKFLLKPITKALAPVNDLFNKILGGLFKILAAKALIKLIDWFTDPENKEKIDSIGRFIKDFWPAIVAGFLLFGTGLGSLAKLLIGTGARLIGSLLKLSIGLGKITAKLAAKAAKGALRLGRGALGLVKANPLAATAILGTAAAGVALYGAGKMLGKDKVVENETQRQDATRKGLNAAPSTKDLSAGDKEAMVQGTRLRDAGGPGSLNDMPNMFTNPLGISGGGMAQGTDVVPAMLTPGEFIMSKGAVQKYGTDTLESMNAAGGGTNKPKQLGGTTYAAGGGKIDVKGTGNSVEGTLKMTDASGKQVGKTYGVISGTYAGMNIPQNARGSTRNAPIPDGNYKLVGFEKHGPYPGLAGIGDWSTYIANGSGSIGSRSGLMLHSDIGSNGTLGCIGVELGGKAGTKAEQEFLKTYEAINPQSIKIALGGGGGDASEIASVDRTASPDNSSRLAALQPAQSGSPRVSPGAITPPSGGGKVAPGSQSIVPIPTGGGGAKKGAKSDVPTLGSVDPLNIAHLVMRSMYNLGSA